jgi:hypothetical protein
MAKLCMRACMLAYLTACLTACMPGLTACLTACPTDCRRDWQVRPYLQEGNRRRLFRQLHQHRKEYGKQHQLLIRQQQPDGRSAPTTSTDDDHRAGAQLHPSQGPPGPLGVVLTSPPAVLGGPQKTVSGLPVLGEVKDSDVSIDIDTTSSPFYELGLDAATLSTDKRTPQQHRSVRLHSDSRS